MEFDRRRRGSSPLPVRTSSTPTRNSSLWALTVDPDASFPPPFTPAYRDEEYMGWVVVVSVLTPQWLGWVTKKWPHVWWLSARLSGQPKPLRRLARDVAHLFERADPCARSARCRFQEDKRKELRVVALTG